MTRPKPLPSPVIRPLHEEDIDTVVLDAGGRRASPDSSREAELNPDFRLGNAVIELKLLNDEGLLKPERQAKIAELFLSSQPGRPVVVVDPRLLSKTAARDYAAIMEGPVRGAVAKGRAQLKHYRLGNDVALATVLFVINNGFAALAHDELVEHVVRRAKNDTDQIDAVVVAGCYFHSDGFDTFALWPMDHIAIHSDRPFAEFDALKAGWDKLAGRHMTEFVRGEHGVDAKKQPVADIVFDIAGVTYVKPAPGLGNKSDFYGRHRPRLNEVDFDELETVATTVPRLSRYEHRRFRDAMPYEVLLSNHEAWSAHMEEAYATSEALRPVIPIDVTRSGWEAWRRHHPGLQASTLSAPTPMIGSTAKQRSSSSPPRRCQKTSFRLGAISRLARRLLDRTRVTTFPMWRRFFSDETHRRKSELWSRAHAFGTSMPLHWLPHTPCWTASTPYSGRRTSSLPGPSLLTIAR